MSAAEWEVSPLPPAPESPPPSGAENGAGGSGELASGPSAAVASSAWTAEDVQRLKDYISAPYRKLAETMHADWLALSELEATMTAVPISSWMPVEWIRNTSGEKIPPLLGAALTALAVAAVNVPRLTRWNAEHPEQFIAVPFITRKGARRGSTQPGPAARAADDGRGQSDRPGGGIDRGEGGRAAEQSAAPGSVDGGPPADTVDDLRRRYAS